MSKNLNSVKSYKLVRNALRCTACGDIIESKHRHDFVTCYCGSWSVDGGLDYVKRSFKENPFVPQIDLCEWEVEYADGTRTILPDMPEGD